tara:strand:- start:30 stop:449 length:420 start_codon:yes stop_codon:yes gene_type:complete
MIYLYASSSNEIAFIPSQSFSNGDGVRAVFTNRFSEVETLVDLNVTMSGNWARTPITLPTDIDLIAGSYDLLFQKIQAGVLAVWGTFGDVWSTSDTIWGIGEDVLFLNDTTTTAFVSQSIGRTLYISANENAAYVVYNG